MTADEILCLRYPHHGSIPILNVFGVDVPDRFRRGGTAGKGFNGKYGGEHGVVHVVVSVKPVSSHWEVRLKVIK